MLSLSNVGKSFVNEKGETQNVLNGVTFKLYEGETKVLLGRNGTGKSTLVNLITGITKADFGSLITWNVEHRIGICFQEIEESFLPQKSGLENLLLPISLSSRSVEDARMRIDQLYEHHGIQLDLSKKVRNLSGGQQQMLSILRAILLESNVMVLDEPFSKIDLKNIWKWRKLVTDYITSSNCSTFMITHNPDEAVLMADSVLILGSQTPELGSSILKELDCSEIKKNDPKRFDQVGFDSKRKEIVGLLEGITNV
ncbi:MAG: ATP-binding cassette domain-containing protein [Cyclobacteriaceae bacterium]